MKNTKNTHPKNTEKTILLENKFCTITELKSDGIKSWTRFDKALKTRMAVDCYFNKKGRLILNES